MRCGASWRPQVRAAGALLHDPRPGDQAKDLELELATANSELEQQQMQATADPCRGHPDLLPQVQSKRPLENTSDTI